MPPKGIKQRAKVKKNVTKKKKHQRNGTAQDRMSTEDTEPQNPYNFFAVENCKEEDVEDTVHDLLVKADQLLETYEPELAERIYQKALNLEPDNTNVMDSYATMLLDMDRFDEAKELLQRSVQLEPEGGWFKYLNIGQLLEGNQAIQCYQQALMLMDRERKELMEEGAEEEVKSLSEMMCSTLVSQAEIYLTDECFAENAESECERILQEALKVNAKHMEALQTMASFKISQQKPEEALQYLTQSYELWKDITDETERPPMEFCHNAAKLFMELGHPQEAADIWSTLIDEDDTIAELHYHLGLATRCFSSSFSLQALNKAKELLQEDGCEEEALLKIVEEVISEVEKENVEIPDEGEEDMDDE